MIIVMHTHTHTHVKGTIKVPNLEQQQLQIMEIKSNI